MYVSKLRYHPENREPLLTVATYTRVYIHTHIRIYIHTYIQIPTFDVSVAVSSVLPVHAFLHTNTHTYLLI